MKRIVTCYILILFSYLTITYSQWIEANNGLSNMKYSQCLGQKVEMYKVD